MRRSVLETIFRHKFLLGLPIVICVVMATAAVLQMGRDYSASGSFWADTPPPHESTNGTTATDDDESPPSAGEATWLQQLLQTRTFMQEVVLASPLADEYKAAEQVAADRILSTTSASISVSAAGPQLVTVSVHRPDGEEALALATAVLSQFEKSKADQSVARAKENVAYNKQVLDAAKAAAKRSDDTNTLVLRSEAQQDYDESLVNLKAAESMQLLVVDSPVAAYPAPRLQRVALGAIGGFLAGMTLSIVLLLVILSRDTSLRNEKDAATAFGLPVVGSVPDAPAKGSRSWNPSNRLRPTEDLDRELVGS